MFPLVKCVPPTNPHTSVSSLKCIYFTSTCKMSLDEYNDCKRERKEPYCYQELENKLRTELDNMYTQKNCY